MTMGTSRLDVFAVAGARAEAFVARVEGSFPERVRTCSDPSVAVQDATSRRAARAAGCRTIDGSGIAVWQAVEAFRLSTGRDADPGRMRVFFAEAAAG